MIKNSSPSTRRLRQLKPCFSGLAYAGAFAFLLGNIWLEARARGRVHTKLDEVPDNQVGLVLGTSRYLAGGNENPFFAGRIQAAAKLYRAGKVHHLILSGDNSAVTNDEPADMRQALLEKGVPEAATTVDDAGFRTLDSFARAKAVFGVDRLTIITDDFHAARSVMLARHFGIEASAYCSEPVPMKWSMKTRTREVGARCKALLDLYLFRTAPHFLGPRIQLPVSQASRAAFPFLRARPRAEG